MSSEEKPQQQDENLESVMYEYAVNTDALEEENQLLRQTVKQLRNEIERYRVPPLMVCEISEKAEGGYIIKIPNGNKFFTTADSEDVYESGDTVLCEQKNLTILKKIAKDKRFNVEQFTIIHKPEVKFSDIGGLDSQVEEIQEVVELPLKKPELFKAIGIHPPKGVLLYGEPGTGKTLLAKAVANASDATFIEVVGSELVQKFIGEGAKMIKEIFELARERAPTVVFIDEIDALASKRIEIGTSGEREVQRTFMQLLAELDGFKPLDNVKIIAATNRKDILDPAIVRPGRFDRLIHIPKPSDEAIAQVFSIHTANMKLDSSFNDSQVLARLAEEDFSGAEIRNVCMEAGYLAIREDRSSVGTKDFLSAIAKVKADEQENEPLTMFG